METNQQSVTKSPISEEYSEVRISHRRRATAFIKQFEKSPKGIVCPTFYVLSHANGCVYNCAYCYLKHTMRHTLTDSQQPQRIVFNNYDDLGAELDKWIGLVTEPVMLNTGELSDSFLDPGYLKVLFTKVFNHNFRNFVHILFVTKGAQNVVDILKAFPVLSNFIVSFSVSTNAGFYERDAPRVEDRLAAAKYLREKGWRVRLRIDPLMPEEFSRSAIDQIEKVAAVNPETITLGSLRFSHGWNYNNMLRMATCESDTCGEDGRAFKVRLPFEKRQMLYEKVMDALRDAGYAGPFALCKETVSMHIAVGLGIGQPQCNCAIIQK